MKDMGKIVSKFDFPPKKLLTQQRPTLGVQRDNLSAVSQHPTRANPPGPSCAPPGVMIPEAEGERGYHVLMQAEN